MKNSKKFSISLTFICLFLLLGVTTSVNVVGSDERWYVGYSKAQSLVMGVTAKIKTIDDSSCPGGWLHFMAQWVGISFGSHGQQYFIQLGYMQTNIFFLPSLLFYWEVWDVNGHNGPNFQIFRPIVGVTYTYTIWQTSGCTWKMQIREGAVERYLFTVTVNTGRTSSKAQALCEMTSEDWDIDGTRFTELKYKFSGSWRYFDSITLYERDPYELIQRGSHAFDARTL